MAPTSASAPVSAVVLIDGVCNLCHRSVQFIIDRDPVGRFRFAAQQSPVGRRLLQRHGAAAPAPAEDPEGVILLEGDRVYHDSSAALRIARGLRFPWSLLSVLLLVPRPLRDWLYRAIARRRYRWFGRAAECRVPTPALRARFLDG